MRKRSSSIRKLNQCDNQRYACVLTQSMNFYMNAEHKHERTSTEENFGAVKMLPCTGYMQRRPIVAVVCLHESSLINHELNAI